MKDTILMLLVAVAVLVTYFTYGGANAKTMEIPKPSVQVFEYYHETGCD
jgi:hypothetical protein